MTEADIKKWYVVRAVSGQENKIKSYIETEISRFGYSDYVEEVLVPTEKVIQIRAKKKKKRRKKRRKWKKERKIKDNTENTMKAK